MYHFIFLLNEAILYISLAKTVPHELGDRVSNVKYIYSFVSIILTGVRHDFNKNPQPNKQVSAVYIASHILILVGVYQSRRNTEHGGINSKQQ